VLRALVCSARAAEDAGRFREAASAWRALKEDEQVLRCHVFDLEAGGRFAEAARLLEAKTRYQAAGERWQRAGDTDAVTRCEAMEHERRGRLEEAAARWAALGDRKSEARCRAILHFRRAEYESAARAYQQAGFDDMAVMSRLMEVRLRGDYDGARRLLEEANVPGLSVSSLGSRERFMEESRALAASLRQGRTRGRRGSTPPPPAPPPPTAPPPDVNSIDAVLAVVRDHPGLTCEDIAASADMNTAQVKPILAALVGRRILVKTGRTRGTRYWPPERTRPGA
jgi:hypothetical protein